MKKLTVCSLAIAVLTVGCATGRSLAGDWNVSASEMPPGVTMRATFENGGGMNMKMTMPKDLGQGKVITLIGNFKGKYKHEGEFMSFSVDSVKFTTEGLSKDEETRISSGFPALEKAAKDQMNKDGFRAKFAWVDDNTFTVTGANGIPQTFKRAN